MLRLQKRLEMMQLVLKVYNLTQKIYMRIVVLTQKMTQINKNYGTRCILDAMMKIQKNLRNYRDGTVMVPMSIHVALMPYVQD